MKRAIIKTFVLYTTTFVFAALGSTAAYAQGAQADAGRLRLESLDRLAPRAAETVNIEIDGLLIKIAGSILSDKDADERVVKEFVAGLKGVYVKSYEFKSGGQYTEADVAAVREQLRGPGWSRVVDIESRGLDVGDAELYLATAGGRVEGLALLVVEPKQVTVINIVGAVDIDKLKKIEGNLSLPRIHIRRKRND